MPRTPFKRSFIFSRLPFRDLQCTWIYGFDIRLCEAMAFTMKSYVDKTLRFKNGAEKRTRFHIENLTFDHTIAYTRDDGEKVSFLDVVHMLWTCFDLTAANQNDTPRDLLIEVFLVWDDL